MEPRTPTPSAADKDNKEQMRAVIAAAEAALGVGDGASTSAVAQAESSSPASAPPSDEYYRGFMAFQSMQHHAEVARRQAQHASDLPPSPEPSTLPFPSFLSQPLTAPTAGTSAAAAPAATVGEHQSSTGAPPSSAAGADPVETEHPCELAPVATARSTTPQANARGRAPSARSGAARPVINPGSVSRPFTSEKARSAASKRWSAAAARRRAKGVPSLSSVPGLAGTASPAARPTTGGPSAPSPAVRAAEKLGKATDVHEANASAVDEASASAALLALGSGGGALRSHSPNSATVPTAATSAATATSATSAVAAASSQAAALAKAAAAKARTAAATKASLAARMARAAAAANAVGGVKAGDGREAVRGGKTGSGREAAGHGKAGCGRKVADVVLGDDEELTELQGVVSEINKLKLLVVNLTATVKTHTEQLDTQSHAVEGLTSSLNALKIEVRTACKPAPQSSAARRIDGDDEEAPEDPRPRKRVRFALPEAEKVDGAGARGAEWPRLAASFPMRGRSPVALACHAGERDGPAAAGRAFSSAQGVQHQDARAATEPPPYDSCSWQRADAPV